MYEAEGGSYAVTHGARYRTAYSLQNRGWVVNCGSEVDTPMNPGGIAYRYRTTAEGQRVWDQNRTQWLTRLKRELGLDLDKDI